MTKIRFVKDFGADKNPAVSLDEYTGKDGIVSTKNGKIDPSLLPATRQESGTVVEGGVSQEQFNNFSRNINIRTAQIETTLPTKADKNYVDPHIADTSIHFTMGNIVIEENQISDLRDYALSEEVRKKSGFENPLETIINYDKDARTITLTGLKEARFRGELIFQNNGTWTSPPHPETLNKTYFLYYNGDGFQWTEAEVEFADLLIALVVYRTTDKFAIRECHSLQSPEGHRTDHYNIGTYRVSGGDVTAITLDSTTAINRRPLISECLVYDEDLPTILPELNTRLYALRRLSGSTDIVYEIDSADIVRLSGGLPVYNSFTGGVWGETALPNNSFMSVYIYGVPVTADSNSQRYRFSIVQGQSFTQAVNASPSALEEARQIERSKTTVELNLGISSMMSAEYVALQKIVIGRSGSTWFITDNIRLAGTRASQIGSIAGDFLTSVSTDTTITGIGRTGNPLSVADFLETNIWTTKYFQMVTDKNGEIYQLRKVPYQELGG